MLTLEQASNCEVLLGTGEAIEKENVVEFRLLYSGELVASGNKATHAKDKHAIRRALHPQLRRQWSVNGRLRQLAASHAQPLSGVSEEDRVRNGLVAIGNIWNRGGFNFVPLVTENHTLRCSLDVTLLRPQEKQFVFKQGDLDGQLKTLFDALRIAKNREELAGAAPDVDEDPFFCLLEDDRLISEVKITSDQLLMLPNTRAVKATDAFVVIHVRLNHEPPRTFDNYFA